MRGAALAAAVGLLVGFAPPEPASASEVSRAELAALSEQARSDPAALDELRAVTSVEGASVDLAGALGEADPSELDARLEELAAAASAPSEAPDAGLAGERVEEIVVEEEDEVAEPSGGIELGVPLWVGAALAVVALLVGALLGRRFAGQRVLERERADATSEQPESRPTDLERAADAAEEQGEFSRAVRLRFRAGLARLDALGALRLRPSLTATVAARELDSGRLAELAGSYQGIVFGGVDAQRSDAERAREGWRAVIGEAGGR